MSDARFERPRPHSVAIVAMGASSKDYINIAAQSGGRLAIADETWAINAMGNIIAHDRLFAMDDMSELVHDARRYGKKVANGMLEWLPRHPGPVYMIREYPQVPGAVEYPVEDVLNFIGFPYFNNTVAYTVAYAMYIGVKAIKLYGCDFTYPNQHQGEEGRGNVEWLLGMAGAKGIHIEVSDSTTLMDGFKPLGDRLYGFDETAVPEQQKDGSWKIRFPDREKDAVPTEPRVVQEPMPDGGPPNRLAPSPVPQVVEAAG